MAQQKKLPAEPTGFMALDEYDAIESAVMETARGRWFLSEFAQRHRVADTETLLNAIAKLDNSIGAKSTQTGTASSAALTYLAGQEDSEGNAGVYKIRMAVSELSAAIQLTRQEIADLNTNQIADGGIEPEPKHLSEISSQFEQAISDILIATEAIQASASTLREQGIDAEICDALDQQAIDIYASCTIQDATARTTAKLIALVNFMEDEVHSILKHWETGDTGASSELSQEPDDGESNSGESDTRPSDGFEDAVTALANSNRETSVDAGQCEEMRPANEEVATRLPIATDDPFAGQDAFESTDAILKWADRS